LISDVIEVLKYDFTYLLFFISGRDSIRIGFLNIEIVLVNPIFTLHITFSAMYMDRLISFIRIEEKPPA